MYCISNFALLMAFSVNEVTMLYIFLGNLVNFMNSVFSDVDFQYPLKKCVQGDVVVRFCTTAVKN